MSVSELFQNWATGFSGCDGGNLQGAIWFCGIEWGGEDEHDLETELSLPVVHPPQLYQAPGDILKWPQYGVRLMKLITAIRGRPVADYQRVAYANPFPFHRDSDYFKMNLFPVAFRGLSGRRWPDKYRDATGIPTLPAYLQWCRENRFPRIRSWMEQRQPKLVVGVGKTYRDDFIKAFGGSGRGREQKVEAGSFLVTEANAGKSRLAIIPFLGYMQGSLNRDQQLQAVGDRLGAILNEV